MFRTAKFIQVLRRHSNDMKTRWRMTPQGEGFPTASTGITVLTEELGKAARQVNKMYLTNDIDLVAQYRKELGHRLITVASVAMRLAETHANEGGTE